MLRAKPRHLRTSIISVALIVNVARVVSIGRHDDAPASRVDRPEDGVAFDYSSVAGTAELEVALAATSQPTAHPGNGP